MSKTREIFTTVDATATAETRFKSATFNVTTHATGADTADARKTADLILQQVMKAIKNLNAQGACIDTDGLKCTYDQQPWQEYDRQTSQQVHKGYQVTGSVVCATDKVDGATRIQDALSKIQGASVQRPTFVADESFEARAAAFKAAYDRAIEDFRMQCRALGKDPNDYEVVRYSPSNEAHHHSGARAASAMMAEAPAMAPAEIKAGRAEISAYVSLAFARKAGPATRSSSSKSRGGARSTSDAPTA